MLDFNRYAPRRVVHERLVLEPLCAAHADEMFEPLSNPAHYTFIPQEPPASLKILRERYTRLESRRSPNGRELWLNWAIRLTTGQAAGLVQATGFPEGKASIAYELFEAFQGKGIATEAVRAALLHLRDDAGLTRATALADTRNKKSHALLERLGFERTRMIKDADFFKGSTSDEYEYQIDLRRLS